MTRSIIVGGIAGFSMGSIGYNLQIIFWGQPSIWNYLLAIAGVFGVIGVILYRRRLRNHEAEK